MNTKRSWGTGKLPDLKSIRDPTTCAAGEMSPPMLSVRSLRSPRRAEGPQLLPGRGSTSRPGPSPDVCGTEAKRSSHKQDSAAAAASRPAEQSCHLSGAPGSSARSGEPQDKHGELPLASCIPRLSSEITRNTAFLQALLFFWHRVGNS